MNIKLSDFLTPEQRFRLEYELARVQDSYRPRVIPCMKCGRNHQSNFCTRKEAN